MYSYEDRLRAVRLYVKLGKRVGLTICQSDYRTKNALKHWYREYEQCLDLSAGGADTDSTNPAFGLLVLIAYLHSQNPHWHARPMLDTLQARD